MTAASDSEITTKHEEIMMDFPCIMKLILPHILVENICLSKDLRSFSSTSLMLTCADPGSAVTAEFMLAGCFLSAPAYHQHAAWK